MFKFMKSVAIAVKNKAVQVVKGAQAFAVAVVKGAQAFAVATAVVLSTMFSAAPSHAAVDPAVAAGLTALQADAATLGGLATAAVVTIMLIILGIRLIKKILGRSV